jgi:hypothetical protein
MLLMLIIGAATIYGGGTNYPYYGLPFVIFGTIGYIFCVLTIQGIITGRINWKQKIQGKNSLAVKISCVICALLFSCFLTIISSQNLFLTKYHKEDLWQYKFAEIINKDKGATVYNFGSLDLGIYTVTGQIPKQYFICYHNLDWGYMTQQIKQYILEGQADYVVMRDGRPGTEELLAHKYEKILDVDTYFEWENVHGSCSLWHLKTEESK